jgi:Xaa-Pro aminopeptidase
MSSENKSYIKDRLTALRQVMAKAGVDYFLATSSDYHASEYVSDFFKVTEYLSGCTSDNVHLLVSKEGAWLWTDGRFFISAAGELAGTEWQLMKMGEPGVPTIEKFLTDHLKSGQTLGFDGRAVTVTEGESYKKLAESCGAKVKGSFAPADEIWTDRPAMPSHSVYILPVETVGEDMESKVDRVRDVLKTRGCQALVMAKLDDIMWLLNMRGDDVHCNPVALSYLILGQDTIDLFIQESEITEDFRAYAIQHEIALHPYEKFFRELSDWKFEGKVFLDPDASSFALKEACAKAAGAENLVNGANPTTAMKAVKNEVELKNSRKCYLDDSVALCKFMYWLQKEIGKQKITEISAADHLDHLRSEIPGYIELSFDTISAYNANAAMAHYAPTEESCAELKPEGFLLVDSGGTYMNGTTDVTRTIVLGKLSRQMIEDYTTVAVSNLRLLYARFPYGANGIALDTYARAPFWDKRQNFNHGTGHGVGYILNVHEGPQSIRWRNANVVFEPGMITSDEPGIYIENAYGIRIESIVECVEDETNEFGRFLRFDPLTYAPIDLQAIDPSLMEKSDIEKLNDYHKKVWEKVSPYLEGDELEWLRKATRAVEA